MAKGSRLARLLNYFREADADEARVVFTLVKEVMDERLKQKIAKEPVKRRKRRTKAELEAAKLAEMPKGVTSGGEQAKASD